MGFSREQGHPLMLAFSLEELGRAEWAAGNLVGAGEFLGEAQRLAEAASPDRSLQAYIDLALGQVAWAQGQLALARATLEKGLGQFRGLRLLPSIGDTLFALGLVDLAEAQLPLAAEHFGQSLEIQRKYGNRRGIAENLEGFAALAVQDGQPARAARLLGAAMALREQIGAPVPPVERAGYERTVVAARDQLGEAVFDEAHAEGRTMTWEQAVDYAQSA